MTQNHNLIKIFFILLLFLIVGCSQQPAKDTSQSENFTNTVIPINPPVISTQTPEILQMVDKITETSATEHKAMSDIESLTVSEVLQILNEQVNDNFIKSGWLHILSHKKFDNDNGNNGKLPDGRIIPNEHTLDVWLLLDDMNQVIQSATFMKTMDGTIIQASIFSNEMFWDPITGIRKESLSFEFLAKDFNISKAVQMLIEYGDPELTEVIIVEFEDRQVVQITNFETYTEPITNSVDFNKPIIGIDSYCYFDIETGQGLAKKVVIHFSDGTERIFEETYSEITNEDNLPNDVLQYFENMQ